MYSNLNNRNVYLTGFMATGKSRIGQAIAQKLDWEFLDTDALIEQRTGKIISDIFAESGEAYFRTLEMELMHELNQLTKKVISLGGGTLTNPGAIALVRQNGLLIRLWAPVDTLVERIGRKETRPLMAGLSEEERKLKVMQMLKAREEFYSQADFSIESKEDLPIKNMASEILHRLSVWSYKSITVTPASSPAYPIFIGTGYIKELATILRGLEINTDFLICTDKNVARKQAETISQMRKCTSARIFEFPPGEENKNFLQLNKLYTFMLKRGYSRKTTLLQFSGGVVGDMAGFGAATYQRGIPFIQIPTTLLSMVDSSVGGKVAVNHPMGKNMIGAFYQPKAVIIDLDTLKTLPHEEYLSGLAEVVKYGVIRDESFFTYLENNVKGLLNKEPEILKHIVQRSCELKAEVVSIDEKEHGIRAILNFGHTFGHAIEKVTNYKQFSHGIAVSLGMRVAARLASLMVLWSPAEEDRLNDLLNALGLPKSFAIDPQEAWLAMGVDKKVEKTNRVYILPEKMGSVHKVLNAPEPLVQEAWDVIRVC